MSNKFGIIPMLVAAALAWPAVTSEASNQPPVLDPIGPQWTQETIHLNFGVSATDPDGTTPTLFTSPLPSGAAFIDKSDGSGVFDWTPDLTQSGNYDVTFYATDGVLVDSEVVSITVLEMENRPPILDSIGAQTTAEGVNLSVSVSATDPDEVIPILATRALPSGAVFVDSGNGNGAFDWTPGFTQAGLYGVTFYTSDGALLDSEVVSITVQENTNQEPVLDFIGPQFTAEGINLNFGVSATDPNGTTPTLFISSLPPGALFVDTGHGSGFFDWTPDFTQGGVYCITFYASDGILIDSEMVCIVVGEGHFLPVLDPIGPQWTQETVHLNFGVSAADPNGTTLFLYTSPLLPSGAVFIDYGDGSGAFDWTPDSTQSGSYEVTFHVTDGVLADSELVNITVLEQGAPSKVDLRGPDSDSIVYGQHPDFAWTPASDPDPNDTIQYDLRISVDSLFAFVLEVNGLIDTVYSDSVPLETGRRYWWKVLSRDNNGLTTSSEVARFRTYKPGDVNKSWTVNAADIVAIVNKVFKGGFLEVDECAADVNGDAVVNSSDLISLVNYVFKGGAELQAGCG